MEPSDPTGDVLGRTNRNPAFRPKEALAMLSALNGAYWSSRFPEVMSDAPPAAAEDAPADGDAGSTPRLPSVGDGPAHA